MEYLVKRPEDGSIGPTTENPVKECTTIVLDEASPYRHSVPVHANRANGYDSAW